MHWSKTARDLGAWAVMTGCERPATGQVSAVAEAIDIAVKRRRSGQIWVTASVQVTQRIG